MKLQIELSDINIAIIVCFVIIFGISGYIFLMYPIWQSELNSFHSWTQTTSCEELKTWLYSNIKYINYPNGYPEHYNFVYAKTQFDLRGCNS